MVKDTNRVCVRCIMDTTDPEIDFDENGVCNHCRGYEELASRTLIPKEKREETLNRLASEIKKIGNNNEYDCIIGVSGGVDSSYVAYVVRQLGLRPLAVHLDNGWDSELAVSNIKNFLNKLDIDLYTHVLDWEEFKQLQIAFLEASTPDSEVPTDHAIMAVLYKEAAKRNIQYIILGVNTVTEAIHAPRWSYGHNDWRYIKSVNRLFGKIKLKRFPHFSLFNLIYYSIIKRIKIVRILDFVNYKKQEAMRILQDELYWKPYGGKHYESIYTRFFQGYILPNKFNIDKRKSHLSTLIMSGQITREKAMEEMKIPPYSGYMLEEDTEYVLKKFEFSEDEFDRIMSLPVKSFRDYSTSLETYNTIRKLKITRIARKLKLMPAK